MWHNSNMQGIFKAKDILNFQIHAHHPQWLLYIQAALFVQYSTL